MNGYQLNQLLVNWLLKLCWNDIESASGRWSEYIEPHALIYKCWSFSLVSRWFLSCSIFVVSYRCYCSTLFLFAVELFRIVRFKTCTWSLQRWSVKYRVYSSVCLFSLSHAPFSWKGRSKHTDHEKHMVQRVNETRLFNLFLTPVDKFKLTK